MSKDQEFLKYIRESTTEEKVELSKKLDERESLKRLKEILQSRDKET